LSWLGRTEQGPARAGPYAFVVVAARKTSGHDRAAFFPDPSMNPTYSDAEILTSARMAAGMTSRARRPFPTTTAG
jgi:hypothetical protein